LGSLVTDGIFRYRKQVQALNFLAKYCFLWNVQPAGTMFLHMIMMIYGKLWSLLCHHLLDQFYTATVTVEVVSKFKLLGKNVNLTWVYQND
ncbi:hypothetical protein T4D_1108, partial [Trichinella pseudospiralis]